MKNFNFFSVVTETYETKEFSTRHMGKYTYLTNKGFKEFKKDNSPIVIGDVKIRQRRYEDVETSKHPEKVLKKKHRKDIFGVVSGYLDEDYINDNYETLDEYTIENPYVSFDLYEVKLYRHCVGYAWVGENQYVRLVFTNPFFILLPLLLMLLIAFMFSSCPTQTPVNDFVEYIEGTTIDDETVVTDIEQPPLVYFLAFPEKMTLTEKHNTIKLRNLESNKDNYYISYQVYINGEPMTDANGKTYVSGCISPGEQIEYDLWSQLEAGRYDLVCVGTVYDYETLKQAQGENDLKMKATLEQQAKCPKPINLISKVTVEK